MAQEQQQQQQPQGTGGEGGQTQGQQPVGKVNSKLLQHLCWYYQIAQAKDFQSMQQPLLRDIQAFPARTKQAMQQMGEQLDPSSEKLHGGFRGCDLARERTLTREITFEGCAAAFDYMEKTGQPVRLTLKEIVDGKLDELLPRGGNKEDDARIGLSKDLFFHTTTSGTDGCGVDGKTIMGYVNSVSLRTPTNRLPVSVGVGSNAMPVTQREQSEEQRADMVKELGFGDLSDQRKALIAFIPPTVTDPKKDEFVKPIHLLREVVNAVHATELCKTFGGITADQIWIGVLDFEPHEAEELGLGRPPFEHDADDPPEGCERQHNSWMIVPFGHILSHIAQLEASEIKRYGNCVHQLTLPDNTPLPFLLMDTWTGMRYALDTIELGIIKIKRNLVSIPDVYIELLPLHGKSWLNSCKPGQHLAQGKVTATLVMSYTVFPRGLPDPHGQIDHYGNRVIVPLRELRLCASLSDKFPRKDRDARFRLNDDTEQGTYHQDDDDDDEDGVKDMQEGEDGNEGGQGNDDDDGDVEMKDANGDENEQKEQDTSTDLSTWGW